MEYPITGSPNPVPKQSNQIKQECHDFCKNVFQNFANTFYFKDEVTQ